MFIAANDVGVVVNPEPPISEERDRQFSCAEVFSAFCDKQMQAFKQESVGSMIDDARRSIIRMRAGFSVGFLHRNSFSVKVLDEVSQ